MKNILVATDFSNNAYCALFYATQLLKSKPCNFILLNTYNELTPLHGKVAPLFGSKKLMRELKTESEEKLTETFHKIVLDNGNDKHTFKTISQNGDLVKTVVKIIAKENIDLVVMGNKGLTDTADMFFGNNTIKVVNHLKECPVLAIPGEMDFTPPKEIAFVTDYKTGCHPETIAPLLFLAKLSNAAIRVMHINEEQLLSPAQETNRRGLEECLRDTEHSFHQMYDFSDKAKVIDAFLDKLKVDLFAMVQRRHNLFERLTHEPVIKDVSMYSDVPFLVLPDRS
ncbi:universal stress protein [Maribacter sp. ACAM166]|uniref:universal stress protein n=1 Tax=Maribacter sp. ACAM166 TaxID=2508996 RepID=UPI0010FF5B8B|nr:universal stress protein [Maribacter sp. ACAM166]TLP81807.1 universal stress protein [Maribacter sp. ACAM166]